MDHRAKEIEKSLIRSGHEDGTLTLEPPEPGDAVEQYYCPSEASTPSNKVHGMIEDFQMRKLREDDEAYYRQIRTVFVTPRSEKAPVPDGSLRDPHLPVSGSTFALSEHSFVLARPFVLDVIP